MIGPPKVGKSEFWSHGDKTLYIQCEPGLNHLSVMKVVCNQWADFKDTYSLLLKEKQAIDNCPPGSKDTFPYDTIVIDTIDRWVDFANEEVVERGQEKFKAANIYSIGDIPNGLGWNMAKNLVGLSLSKLNELPACIVLIGHLASKELAMENNVKMTFQTVALSPSMGTSICAWADHILNIEGGNKTGDRKVRTRPSGSIMAGSRGNMVPEGFVWGQDSKANYSKLRGLFN